MQVAWMPLRACLSNRMKHMRRLKLSKIGILICLLIVPCLALVEQALGQPRTFNTGAASTTSVSAVTFTPNGKALIVAVHSSARLLGPPFGEIQWWNLSNGKLIRKTSKDIRADGFVLALAFSHNGKTLAVGGGHVQGASFVHLYDTRSWKLKRKMKAGGEYINSVAFSPDDKLLASVGGIRGGEAQLWDVNKGKLRRELLRWDDTTVIHSVAFSRDGSTVMADGFLWDVKTGKTKSAPYSAAIALSPDGKTIARTDEKNNQARDICLSDTQTGKLRHRLQGHTGGVNAMTFSPNGTLLCSSSDDKTVRLWSVKNGKLRHAFKGHKDKVTSVSFAPNGTSVVSGSYDGTVKIWRIK